MDVLNLNFDDLREVAGGRTCPETVTYTICLDGKSNMMDGHDEIASNAATVVVRN